MNRNSKLTGAMVGALLAAGAALATIITFLIHIAIPLLLSLIALLATNQSNQPSSLTTNSSSQNINQQGANSQGNAPNCIGYEKTDPEVPDQGKTVTFDVTVANGCAVIVQGVYGQYVGPYNWENGAVAALGPGSYSFTITDGSYQIESQANAQIAFCNAINWIQTNGKALGEAYPLPGWGSC